MHSEGHESSLDLAFDDQVLHDVQRQWHEIMGGGVESNEGAGLFMQFEERNNMNADDDEDDEY